MNEETRTARTIPKIASVTPLAAARVVTHEIPEVQLVYAQVLDLGVKVGFLLLLACFAPYLLGLLEPRIPVDELPRYWSMPVKDYLAATGMETGWGWVRLLGKGDVLNFLAIAFLSGVVVVCYLLVAPMFFRAKDPVYGWLAVTEVAVLVLAASGLLAVGGH
jgi:hypothetical protein